MRLAAAFVMLAGIAIGVLVSFFGLERRRGRQIKLPHPALNSGAFAPALVAWGAVTYSLERGGWLGPWWNAAIGLLAAAAAWIGVSTLLARFALRAEVAEAAAAAEKIELLHGHLATVVRAIDATSPGEISYRLDGQVQRRPARSVDSSAIPPGTEVVIERLDGDVAYVENWSAVEERL